MRLKLSPGEHIIAAGRPHARSLWKPLTLAGITGALAGYAFGWLGRDTLPGQLGEFSPYLQAVAVLLAVLVLVRYCIPPVLRWYAGRIILTDRRLIQRQGVLMRREHEIALAAIYQLEIRQSVTDRMQRSGTLILDLGHGRIMHYPAVPEVHRFRSIVVAAIGQLPLTAMFDGVDMETNGGYDYEGRDDD
ncbi:PH domain-containing protein [Arthrobacter zhaoxinii]|uniref:PH domain-containing protein n=1 Tax=Arthrobacter zhaoxinii TaxID=2964616 RepID=UPI002105B21D|nr:PH domain-containing protein [Arthrobacter zhaoxinii]MCQ2001816.1 PH domain-containing protein [Arthrobacter zhaoxinii]